MKVKIKDFNGKVEEKDINIPNKLHLEIQKNNPSRTIKPKKGKGSFTRKEKYKNNF